MDEDEGFKICPLVDFSAGTLSAEGIVVVLRYFEDEAAARQGRQTQVAFGILRSRAIELAELIRKTAEAAHIPQPPTSARN